MAVVFRFAIAVVSALAIGMAIVVVFAVTVGMVGCGQGRNLNNGLGARGNSPLRRWWRRIRSRSGSGSLTGGSDRLGCFGSVFGCLDGRIAVDPGVL